MTTSEMMAKLSGYEWASKIDSIRGGEKLALNLARIAPVQQAEVKEILLNEGWFGGFTLMYKRGDYDA